MWLFKSVKTLAESGMLEGFTDWHSHILPGVDDGVASMDEALAVLREYEKLGIKKVWLTPHIMEDYPNTTGVLRERFEELRQHWDGGVVLALGAENMLDPLFEERLDAGDVLPVGDGGRCLLVETSYYNPPVNFDSMLEKIKKKGYFPVLAHPERYIYMDRNEYKRLKGKGILFQINFISLVGAYGETARDKAEWLISQGYADVTGSDLHRLESTLRFLNKSARKSSVMNSLMELSARTL